MISGRDGAGQGVHVHVTGANGFIGGAVLARLHRAGYRASGSDIGCCGEMQALDLRDRAAVFAHIAGHRPDVVVHAGAISGAMLAQDDPALMFEVNVTGTLNLAEAMRRAGVGRMVFLSSNAVYAPALTRDPVTEDAALGAADPYGASKLAAETILRAYAMSHGLAVTALRISSVFGAGRVTPYLVSQTLESIRAGEPFTVTDDRSNMRQFVHVDDAAAAVCRAVEVALAGFTPVNITGGTYLSEETIVRLLLGKASTVPVTVIADRGRDDDGRVGPLDIGRAKELLGYVPSVEMSSALAAMAGPIVAGAAPTS